MKYRLKKRQEGFDVVDGPLAGRKFRKGLEYDEADIPASERHKFEKVPEPKKATPAATKRGGKKS